MVRLPDPLTRRGRAVTTVMRARQSLRRFSSRQLALDRISYLLWACQGRCDPEGDDRRTTPSAGATYPLEIYLVCGARCVKTLQSGIYHYLPEDHGLLQISGADPREALADACFSQDFISEAPASIVIAADYARTGTVYGERGVRYVHIEVGHAGQNVYLACAAMGLGTVAVGAFNDEDVARTLELPIRIEPVYVMPVGHPR
jgi:SagB-type dehydrogenase family enzyme